jgi:tripartite-type tricarboxylate transporter receptor subunit TctC
MTAGVRRNMLTTALAAVSVFLIPIGARGQDYPTKVVRMIVPFASRTSNRSSASQ